MTLRDWIARRSGQVPPALVDRILAALGSDADADEARAAEVCLGAAARALDELLSSERFERDSALTLLAIDALTTYGYEHASGGSNPGTALQSLADRGSHAFGRFVNQRA